MAMKSLNEKWLSIVQSTGEKGENEIGGSSTVTIHHKGAPSHRQYLVQWKGYSADEDSWLPEEEFSAAKELLLDYKNSLHSPHSPASC